MNQVNKLHLLKIEIRLKFIEVKYFVYILCLKFFENLKLILLSINKNINLLLCQL